MDVLSQEIKIILGVIVSIVMMIFVSMVVGLFLWRKYKNKSSVQNENKTLDDATEIDEHEPLIQHIKDDSAQLIDSRNVIKHSNDLTDEKSVIVSSNAKTSHDESQVTSESVVTSDVSAHNKADSSGTSESEYSARSISTEETDVSSDVSYENEPNRPYPQPKPKAPPKLQPKPKAPPKLQPKTKSTSATQDDNITNDRRLKCGMLGKTDTLLQRNNVLLVDMKQSSVFKKINSKSRKSNERVKTESSSSSEEGNTADLGKKCHVSNVSPESKSTPENEVKTHASNVTPQDKTKSTEPPVPEKKPEDEVKPHASNVAPQDKTKSTEPPVPEKKPEDEVKPHASNVAPQDKTKSTEPPVPEKKPEDEVKPHASELLGDHSLEMSSDSLTIEPLSGSDDFTQVTSLSESCHIENSVDLKPKEDTKNFIDVGGSVDQEIKVTPQSVNESAANRNTPDKKQEKKISSEVQVAANELCPVDLKPKEDTKDFIDVGGSVNQEIKTTPQSVNESAGNRNAPDKKQEKKVSSRVQVAANELYPVDLKPKEDTRDLKDGNDGVDQEIKVTPQSVNESAASRNAPDKKQEKKISSEVQVAANELCPVDLKPKEDTKDFIDVGDSVNQEIKTTPQSVNESAGNRNAPDKKQEKKISSKVQVAANELSPVDLKPKEDTRDLKDGNDGVDQEIKVTPQSVNESAANRNTPDKKQEKKVSPRVQVAAFSKTGAKSTGKCSIQKVVKHAKYSEIILEKDGCKVVYSIENNQISNLQNITRRLLDKFSTLQKDTTLTRLQKIISYNNFLLQCYLCVYYDKTSRNLTNVGKEKLLLHVNPFAYVVGNKPLLFDVVQYLKKYEKIQSYENVRISVDGLEDGVTDYAGKSFMKLQDILSYKSQTVKKLTSGKLSALENIRSLNILIESTIPQCLFCFSEVDYSVYLHNNFLPLKESYCKQKNQFNIKHENIIRDLLFRIEDARCVLNEGDLCVDSWKIFSQKERNKLAYLWFNKLCKFSRNNINNADFVMLRFHSMIEFDRRMLNIIFHTITQEKDCMLILDIDNNPFAKNLSSDEIKECDNTELFQYEYSLLSKLKYYNAVEAEKSLLKQYCETAKSDTPTANAELMSDQGEKNVHQKEEMLVKKWHDICQDSDLHLKGTVFSRLRMFNIYYCVLYASTISGNVPSKQCISKSRVPLYWGYIEQLISRLEMQNSKEKSLDTLQIIEVLKENEQDLYGVVENIHSICDRIACDAQINRKSEFFEQEIEKKILQCYHNIYILCQNKGAKEEDSVSLCKMKTLLQYKIHVLKLYPNPFVKSCVPLRTLQDAIGYYNTELQKVLSKQDAKKHSIMDVMKKSISILKVVQGNYLGGVLDNITSFIQIPELVIGGDMANNNINTNLTLRDLEWYVRTIEYIYNCGEDKEDPDASQQVIRAYILFNSIAKGVQEISDTEVYSIFDDNIKSAIDKIERNKDFSERKTIDNPNITRSNKDMYTQFYIYDYINDSIDVSNLDQQSLVMSKVRSCELCKHFMDARNNPFRSMLPKHISAESLDKYENLMTYDSSRISEEKIEIVTI